MKNENNVDQGFLSLDLGTKVSTVRTSLIEVEIKPEMMLGDYAKKYYARWKLANPNRVAETGLKVKDLEYYFTGLLKIRIDYVNDECSCWREAKKLYVPGWIQFSMSRVGRITDRKRGLVFVPVMAFEFDIKKMLEISEKLEFAGEDGFAVFEEAFPAKTTGEIDTMSMAIIDNVVVGQLDVPQVNGYVAAFLGFTLKKSNAFNMLYRVTYDDVNLIADELLRTRELY